MRIVHKTGPYCSRKGKERERQKEIMRLYQRYIHLIFAGVMLSVHSNFLKGKLFIKRGHIVQERERERETERERERDHAHD